MKRFGLLGMMLLAATLSLASCDTAGEDDTAEDTETGDDADKGGGTYAYTVTFDKQSGTGGSDSVTATLDAAMPAATAPTRIEFVFQGYWDGVSGGTQYYNADMSSARAWDKKQDATLYARWAEKTYKLRDTGPAGGLIFYINANAATDGWKYLECAPVSTEWVARWGERGASVTGADGTAIGTGEQNTADIVAQFPGSTDRAAQLCGALVFGGYDDWFLPSYEELSLMYVNLRAQGVGGFDDINYYWSSTEVDVDQAWELWEDGSLDWSFKDNRDMVRAVRAF